MPKEKISKTTRILQFINPTSPKKAMLLFAVVFAVIGGSYYLYKSHALKSPDTYTNLTWPTAPANGYNSLEYSITVNKIEPYSSYFWSHQVFFIGGGGGYFGTQSGSSPSQDKIAIFSLWDTVNANGVNCGRFGGEGVGMNCKIPYNWQEGRKYHLTLQKIGGTSANGIWWRASIKDTVTSVTTTIGDIQNIPGGKGLSNYSGMFTEYFAAQPTSCSLQPYVNATFTEMKINGVISPQKYSNGLGGGDCQNSKITSISGGAIHERGNLPIPVTTPYRINAGGPKYVGPGGSVWLQDAYFKSGSAINTASTIAATNKPAIYQTQRYCMNGYSIPVTNGAHQVRLHFAEIYYNSAGKRLMNININDVRVLTNFDVFAKVGFNTADVEAFNTNVTNGWLKISILPAPNSAGPACDGMISGIEIY